MDHIKLKRLEIKKYRNVAPGTVLHFSDGFNILLGKNGTGKTTLLDLIAMIVTSDFSSLKDTEFDFAYTFSMPGGTFDMAVESHVDGRERWFPEGTHWRLAHYEKGPVFVWSYRAQIRIFDKTRGDHIFQFSGTEQALSFTAGGPLYPKPSIRELTAPQPFLRGFCDFLLLRVLAELLRHQQNLLHKRAIDFEFLVDKVYSSLVDQYFTAFESYRSCMENGGRFDEPLAGLQAITGNQADVGSVPHPAKFDLTTKRGMSFSFCPDDLREKLVARLANPAVQGAPPIETIQLSDADLPFLKRIVEALRFESGRLSVQLIGRETRNNQTSSSYGHMGFHFTASDGSIFTEKTLSYGQKRLLSFLYYASANPHIVIADELVNGLHHAWAQTCIQEIADRQSFLASQDPLLFDFLAFASEQEVLESFVLCSLEPGDDRSQFVWKNLDPDAASAFYRAYDAGIQHVSEILRTKGLW